MDSRKSPGYPSAAKKKTSACCRSRTKLKGLSLCNEAYHIASDSHHLHSGFVRKLEATLRQRVSNGTGVILEINSNADLYYHMLSSYIAEHDRFSVVQSLKEVS